MVSMFRNVRCHRHRAGSGRRLIFPQFHRRLDFDSGGLAVSDFCCAALRCVVPRGHHLFEDRVVGGGRPAVGLDCREGRVDLGIVG